MLQHIANRLLISVPVLIGVLLVGFLMLQVWPCCGNTANAVFLLFKNGFGNRGQVRSGL